MDTDTLLSRMATGIAGISVVLLWVEIRLAIAPFVTQIVFSKPLLV